MQLGKPRLFGRQKRRRGNRRRKREFRDRVAKGPRASKSSFRDRNSPIARTTAVPNKRSVLQEGDHTCPKNKECFVGVEMLREYGNTLKQLHKITTTMQWISIIQLHLKWQNDHYNAFPSLHRPGTTRTGQRRANGAIPGRWIRFHQRLIDPKHSIEYQRVKGLWNWTHIVQSTSTPTALWTYNRARKHTTLRWSTAPTKTHTTHIYHTAITVLHYSAQIYHTYSST